jgi:hypothetical protein
LDFTGVSLLQHILDIYRPRESLSVWEMSRRAETH